MSLLTQNLQKLFLLKARRKPRIAPLGKKNQITVIGCAIVLQCRFCLHLSSLMRSSCWTRGEIPDTRYGLSKIGWADQELFQGCMKEHFILHVVQGSPVLLLVDGHSSHYDPETIRFAKDHSSIFIFGLPPHTTHEAQPLGMMLAMLTGFSCITLKLWLHTLALFLSPLLRSWLHLLPF